MAREYFCAYYSYLASMRNLSDAECGRLFRALLQYGSAGDKSINLQGRESIAFDFMAAQIDRDNEAYSERCQKNRKNGALANGTERTRMVPNGTERYQTPPKEKEKKKENIKERLPNGNPKKSIPPSLEEVAAYCEERGNGIDAESFVDFYTARGWTYGKNQQMKDWRAAVRTWEKRRTQEQPKEVDRYADLI